MTGVPNLEQVKFYFQARIINLLWTIRAIPYAVGINPATPLAALNDRKRAISQAENSQTIRQTAPVFAVATI